MRLKIRYCHSVCVCCVPNIVVYIKYFCKLCVCTCVYMSVEMFTHSLFACFNLYIYIFFFVFTHPPGLPCQDCVSGGVQYRLDLGATS